MSRIIEGEIPKPYMEAVTRVGFRRLTIIAGTNHIGVRITQDQADEIVKKSWRYTRCTCQIRGR